jgi:trimeric autotransporter adhesin
MRSKSTKTKTGKEKQVVKNGKIILTTILCALGCFALVLTVQAVTPAPDGGYAGNNTAEGTSSLFNLTSGIDNTALGFQALFHDTTGNSNTAEGFRALFANTNGHQNTATGVNALVSNTTGDFNTANGVNALNHNTDGGNNTATGVQALFSNTSGNFNTATGVAALFHNTTGLRNTASGFGALFSNINGSDNTAIGQDALFNNTFGSQNIATGVAALLNNTGDANTADGYAALSANTGGVANTANGDSALHDNTVGSRNVANGWEAMYRNTSGVENTAIGDETLVLNSIGNYNTAIGSNALHNTTGSNNVALGVGAGINVTSGSYNVYIGAGVAGVAGEVGHTYISNIASTQQNLSPVTVDLATGLLGHEFSSQRYKEDIKPMANASEVLFALKPVTYRYKKEIDAGQSLDYGLVAEDVAKVDPRLAARDGNRQIESVRYTAINAMLLNEFLKEHKAFLEEQCKVQEQRTRIETHEAAMTELKSVVAQQQKSFQVKFAKQEKQIQALTAGLQKVSAQIEANKARPQVVLNDP